MLRRTMRLASHTMRAWMLVVCVTSMTLSVCHGAPEGCEEHIDLTFVIDSSESLRDHDPMDQPGRSWSAIKNFTRDLVRHFSIGKKTKVGTVVFGSTAQVAFYLNWHDNLASLEGSIQGMRQMRGNTNAAAAFRMVRTDIFNGDNGARSQARNIVIFIGDGIANVDTAFTLTEADYVKTRNSAEVFTVAVSPEIDRDNLLAMASEPKDRHFLHVLEVDELGGIVEVLVHRICGMPDPESSVVEPECLVEGCLVCAAVRYCYLCDVGRYFNRTHCADCMGHCDLCRKQETCDKCILGWYWEPQHERCEECKLTADLALVIDSSGSIRDKNPDDNSYDNYQLLKDFLKLLIARLDVGPETTRVAAITFSSKSQVVFPLDAYTQTADLQRAIDNMDFGGGHTNTSGGLYTMREEVFHPDRGDRPGVRNVGIVITDGESTYKNLTLPEAERAKQEGITLFVVGVTDEINEAELKAIASDPVNEHYFNSTEIRQLNGLLVNIIKHICAPENTNAPVQVAPPVHTASFSAWQQRAAKATEHVISRRAAKEANARKFKMEDMSYMLLSP